MCQAEINDMAGVVQDVRRLLRGRLEDIMLDVMFVDVAANIADDVADYLVDRLHLEGIGGEE